MKSEDPKPRRPRPSSRELRCGICGQPYTYPVKGLTSTRRLCVECAELPVSLSRSLLRMGTRIRELEAELKTLSEKLKPGPIPPNGDSP